jgi:hypothetical protein
MSHFLNASENVHVYLINLFSQNDLAQDYSVSRLWAKSCLWDPVHWLKSWQDVNLFNEILNTPTYR